VANVGRNRVIQQSYVYQDLNMESRKGRSFSIMAYNCQKANVFLKKVGEDPCEAL
jgi:hypothetical protein